jgi:signal transduction histidine kinase
LRNPLTSITGPAYYLNTKLGPELGTNEKEMLAIIEKSIRYSDKIVNDLLEYSRGGGQRRVDHKRRFGSYDGSIRNTHSGFNWERTEDTGRRGEDAASISQLSAERLRRHA